MSTDVDDLHAITKALADDVRAIRRTLQLWSSIGGGILLLLVTGGLIWAVDNH